MPRFRGSVLTLLALWVTACSSGDPQTGAPLNPVPPVGIERNVVLALAELPATADELEFVARDRDGVPTAEGTLDGTQQRSLRGVRFELNLPQDTASLEFNDLADDPLQRPVYVHCRGGVGRTGIMVSCYRIRHGLDASQALKLNLEEIWDTGSDLTAEQRHFVTCFQKRAE